jgi:trimethylamine:corrinoid methyltransferase-like protein
MKRLDQKACTALLKRLAEYERPEIDPEIERALCNYMNKAKNK